jgi:hypothetical protein
MIYRIFSIALLLTFLSTSNFSQQITLRGKVVDKISLAPLGFANIRVSGSSVGTSANIKGVYELKILDKNVNIVASFIGYDSDTININTLSDFSEIDFLLTQSKIDLPEILINPGINPALEIIRKAINKKKIRDSQLKNYQVEAYTKGLIRTQKKYLCKQQ